MMKKEQFIVDFIKDRKKFKKRLLTEFKQMLCTGIRFVGTGNDVRKEKIDKKRVSKLIDNIDEVVWILMISKVREYGIRCGFTNEEGGYFDANYEKRINDLVGEEIVPVRNVALDYSYTEKQIKIAMETNLFTEKEGTLKLLKVQRERDLELCRVGKLSDQFDSKYIVKLESDVRAEYKEKIKSVKKRSERMVWEDKGLIKKK